MVVEEAARSRSALKRERGDKTRGSDKREARRATGERQARPAAEERVEDCQHGEERKENGGGQAGEEAKEG